MNLSGIISISGKPGLFKVIAQSKNNIIVESLIDKKRAPAQSTDRISALEDISIYTYESDVPLKEVFSTLAKKENCEAAPSHKESLNKLTAYLEEILPDYDQDRVYPSDIKKLFQWYNILHKAGLVTLEEEEEEEVKEKEEGEEKVKPEPKDKVKEVKKAKEVKAEPKDKVTKAKAKPSDKATAEKKPKAPKKATDKK